MDAIKLFVRPMMDDASSTLGVIQYGGLVDELVKMMSGLAFDHWGQLPRRQPSAAGPSAAAPKKKYKSTAVQLNKMVHDLRFLEVYIIFLFFLYICIIFFYYRRSATRCV